MAATPRRRAATPRRRRAAAIAPGLAAGAGIVCGVLALVAGSCSWRARRAHTSVFTTFDHYIAKAGNCSAVFSCTARPANDIWP